MIAAQSLIDQFRVQPGKRPNIRKRDTRDRAGFENKSKSKALTKELAVDIDGLQNRLFAEGKRSLLVVLQGMDTSGKDGTVQSVFGYTTPLGVSVTSFRRPSEIELGHDFLWRVHQVCPKRGMIGIFNRSHYEDVLVSRVRNLVPKEVIRQRYEQINAFEKMLTENGTTILKFMLHISRDEQKERLQDRLDDPSKNWKFDPGDLEDRKMWDEFEEAYESALYHCSTEWAPWHIIPADFKWVRDAVIANIVKDKLETMNPSYPQPNWKPGDYQVE